MENNKKFRCDVAGKGEPKWSSNAMLYDTREEAEDWLRGLSGRWFGYDMSRIVEDDVPKHQKIDYEDPRIFQNFRKNG